MMKFIPVETHEFVDPCSCQLIGLILGGFSTFFAGLGGAIGTGLGFADAGAAIGAGLEGATVGAGIGAAGSAIEGGNPLTGALEGGITGGAIGGVGPALGGALDIGAEGGDILAGAGAGALGSALTGSSPLTGALEGGVGGAVSGAVNGTPAGPAGTAPGSVTAGGPGPSAAALAPPPGVGDVGNGPFGNVASDAAGGALTAPGGGTTYGPTSPFATDLTQGATLGFGAPQSGGDVFTGAASQTQQPAGVATQTQQPGTPPDPNSAAAGLAAANAPVTFGGTTFPNAGSAAASGAIAQGGPDAAAALAPSGGGNTIANAFSNPSLSTIGSALSANSNWLAPAALIGYEGLKSSESLSNIPGYSGLSNTASQLGGQATQLESYLQTGNLPPGIQQSLTQAGDAAKAAIRGQYASRGMSGSSAEAQDIANVDTTIAGQGAQIATNLLSTGVSEANLSSELYSQILNANLTQDNQLGQALSTLAAGAARPSVTLAGTASG